MRALKTVATVIGIGVAASFVLSSGGIALHYIWLFIFKGLT